MEQEAALARVARSVKLRGRLLYHVAKLQTLVAAETAVFHAERERLIAELGMERDASREERQRLGVATVREVGPGAMPAFRARLEELAAVEVVIPWGPVPFRDLAEFEMVPDDLRAMGALVDLTYDAAEAAG